MNCCTLGSRLSLGLCAVSVLLCWGKAADARQNIVTGEISARYDHQERTYHDNGLVTDSITGGEIAAGVVTDTAAADTPTIIVVEDRRGDRQSYILTPRLTLTSTGINDLIEMTYAPGLNYDHLYETTNLDQDFGLRAERNLTRNWLFTLNERYFLGDDSYRGNELTTAEINPDTGAVVEETTVGSPAAAADGAITEVYGRRRYWTNDLDLTTEYEYGQDKIVRGGYTYSVLRNDDSDSIGGYTDYDRHQGLLGLEYRFNRKWSVEGDAQYTRGLFDEPEAIVAGADAVERVTGAESDDLTEYNLRARGTYDTSEHLHLFTEYSYLQTDYDIGLREDYSVNNIALGVDYDITQRLHITLSGGPSWGSFENSPTETDYNAYAGLTWDYMHGALTFYADKGYDQTNFDGRRSGLTDFWDTGVALDYQLTQALTATFSASYRDNKRLQYPLANTVIVLDDGTTTAGDIQEQDAFDRVEYTEKDYEAGASLAYTFLRWYTVSGGYRYYDHDSDLAEGGTGSYYEHRAFIELAAATELFRW